MWLIFCVKISFIVHREPDWGTKRFLQIRFVLLEYFASRFTIDLSQDHFRDSVSAKSEASL